MLIAGVGKRRVRGCTRKIPMIHFFGMSTTNCISIENDPPFRANTKIHPLIPLIGDNDFIDELEIKINYNYLLIGQELVDNNGK